MAKICSNSAFLHGVEWDRLIVHRTPLSKNAFVYEEIGFATNHIRENS